MSITWDSLEAAVTAGPERCVVQEQDSHGTFILCGGFPTAGRAQRGRGALNAKECCRRPAGLETLHCSRSSAMMGVSLPTSASAIHPSGFL